jgi:hypothetical protein
MSYYFLAASLPMLSMGEPPAISLPEFLSRCEGQLSKSDYQALYAVVHGDDSSHPFAVEWRDRDRQIRNALVRVRAAAQRRDAAPHLRDHKGFDVHSEATVDEMGTRANPLESELALDRLRWSILDELAGHDMFCLGAILAYGLKIRLVERWAAMDEPAGRDRLEEIVTEQMASIRF